MLYVPKHGHGKSSEAFTLLQDELKIGHNLVSGQCSVNCYEMIMFGHTLPKWQHSVTCCWGDNTRSDVARMKMLGQILPDDKGQSNVASMKIVGRMYPGWKCSVTCYHMKCFENVTRWQCSVTSCQNEYSWSPDDNDGSNVSRITILGYMLPGWNFSATWYQMTLPGLMLPRGQYSVTFYLND